MSPEIVGIIGICILLILVFLGMNIGVSMAAVGFFGFAWLAGFNKGISMLGTTVYHTLASYTLTVVPLFVFMGAIISNSGLGISLYEGIRKWMGHLRGGLAIATIAACAVFAAMCGSSLAETATVGKIALPEMKRHGYSDKLATGCVACAGSLAILIPPSIGFVMYGLLTEQPIGILFIAGIIPGSMLSILFVLTVLIIVWLDPKKGPVAPKASIRERLGILGVTGPVAALILLVLGGIYGGIFTPTEAGAIGAFGAIVITYFSGYLDRKKLIESIMEAGTTTAMIIMMVAGAFIFAKFLSISRLTATFPSYISSLGLSPYGALFLIIAFYILLGMFFDVLSGMVLTIPLIYPLIIKLGFDPIWFGVLLVVLMEMGLATPPIGMNVFVLSTVTDVPMETIFKGAWPFIFAIALCLIFLILFPELALYLPKQMTMR